MPLKKQSIKLAIFHTDKGKYFDEEAFLDASDVYVASVIADADDTDVMIISEDTFNAYIKVYTF